MANMSYCRFQNTLAALRDCGDELENIEGNLAELSKEEARAADRLIEMCKQIADAFHPDAF